MVNDRRIELFKRVAVRASNHSANHFKSTHSRALLAFLALQPRVEHPRYKLVEALWPGDDSGIAGNRLSVALYHMKGLLDSLDEGFSECVDATRDFISFDDRHVEIDYREFKADIQSARLAKDEVSRRRHYQRAYTRYGGALAPEVTAPWMVTRRIEAEQMYLDAVVWLAHNESQAGEHEAALARVSVALSLVESPTIAAEFVAQWHVSKGSPEVARQFALGLRHSLRSQQVASPESLETLIKKIDLLVAESKFAVVAMDETVNTLLVGKGVSLVVMERVCHEYGAGKTKDGIAFTFRSPQTALDAAREVKAESRGGQILIHSEIGHESSPVSSAALLSLAQAPHNAIVCTKASAALLEPRGVRARRVGKSRLFRVVAT